MYYETAVVKEYKRKDAKPNKMINAGVNSRFKQGDKVILMYSENIETFKQKNQSQNKELENEIESLKNEIQILKDDLKKVEGEKIEILSENKKVITATNKNLIEAKDKIIEMERQHAKELKKVNEENSELNKKLNNEKDFSKAVLIALNDVYKRNGWQRLRNTEPDSTKKVLELRPKELKVNKKE